MRNRTANALAVMALITGLLLTACSNPDQNGAGNKQSAKGGPAEVFEYLDVRPPQPTSVAGKIEVLEFFWYGCPHCYKFEPYLQKWKKTLPADVVFIRVPAIFNAKWEVHARAYYTAELLGIAEQIHLPLFQAIHDKRQNLFTQEALSHFFAQYGVTPQTFNNTYNSYMVNNRIQQAKQLLAAYKIDGVPTMVVNGKYTTSATLTGSHARAIEVVDQLIEKER
jgi:thiol:disulfide interchange protein DsbA